MTPRGVKYLFNSFRSGGTFRANYIGHITLITHTHLSQKTIKCIPLTQVFMTPVKGMNA